MNMQKIKQIVKTADTLFAIGFFLCLALIAIAFGLRLLTYVIWLGWHLAEIVIVHLNLI